MSHLTPSSPSSLSFSCVTLYWPHFISYGYAGNDSLTWLLLCNIRCLSHMSYTQSLVKSRLIILSLFKKLWGKKNIKILFKLSLIFFCMPCYLCYSCDKSYKNNVNIIFGFHIESGIRSQRSTDCLKCPASILSLIVDFLSLDPTAFHSFFECMLKNSWQTLNPDKVQWQKSKKMFS